MTFTRRIRSTVLAAAALPVLTGVTGCSDGVGPRPTAGASLQILPAPVPSLAVPGDTVRLRAEVRDGAGRTIPDVGVSWEGLHPHVAVVDSEGLVTAVGYGEATIRARAAGLQATARVEVDPEVLVAINFPAPATVRQGDGVRLFVRGEYRDGRLGPVPGVRWSLAGGPDAYLDSTGTLVGYEPGDALRVAATLGDWADTAAIVVVPRGVSGHFTVVGLGAVEGRYTSDFWAYDRHAYTGTWGQHPSGGRGNVLFAWDVSDPSNPVLTDSVVVDAGTVNDVKVSASGDFAVLTHEQSADGANGITILDLADPGSPRVVTRYTDGLENGVHNVWIDGWYIYAVHNGDGGLVILDASDLAAPRELARFHAGTSFVHDVYVRDGLAFVSHWNAGLVILDVGHGIRGGSASDPREVSRIVTSGGHVHNAWYVPHIRYVFVGEEDFATPGRMRVIDVKDLTRPVEVASFFLPGHPPHNFWVDEHRNILFAAWYGNGVRAIDVRGTLLGDLHRQGREYGWIRPVPAGATRPPFGPGAPVTPAHHGKSVPGTGTAIWSPQLHDDFVFASDMNAGLWILGFTASEAP